VIRVGESVWSTWEPENGRFNLDWLQPVLDGAHDRGIAVIMGTPTYGRPAVAGPAVPRDHRGAGHRAAHRLGRPPGGRLHPSRLPVPRLMRDQAADKIHGADYGCCRLDNRRPGALCGIGEWKIIVALSVIVAIVLLTGGPLERWCDTALAKRPKEPL